MLFFIFLSTLALSEAYVSELLDLKKYQNYKDFMKKPSATITLTGPIEAHCIHMTERARGGTFQKDATTTFVPIVKITVAETVLLDRYLVDECRTEQKIRESIVKVTPSAQVDKELPLRVDVEYRSWEDSTGNSHKRRVSYELKSGAYVRGEVEE